MQRSAAAPLTAHPQLASTWLARRWYYTPRSHRSYSVRQVSQGDRRLLAEFVLDLTRLSAARDRSAAQTLTGMIFDQVIPGGASDAVGFAALENTAAGDRIIGVCACGAPTEAGAEFHIAVAHTHREEQIGRNLLATLLRHARRAGVPRLSGEMHWSNRPMQMLAVSMGFLVEPVDRDRSLRHLVLPLK